MRANQPNLRQLFSDLRPLLLLAAARLLLHTATNHQYGFHRDELALLDDAQTPAWGYVAYPPFTPFVGRLALELFGPSLVGVRFFSALAQCIGIVLAGCMARELGGSRPAQIMTALAVAIAPISLIQGALFQYVSFDYLWWVCLGYFALRLLNSTNPRWWLAIGAVIGLGMLTKYTMAYAVAGLVGGVLLTQERRYLTSPWLWGGVGVSLLIFIPNLFWQIEHSFISLEFLMSIHTRDVAIGRTADFLPEQFFVASNPATVPFWIAGLYFFCYQTVGQRYRMLGWLYLLPFLLFWVTQGRSYYLAPAYPLLIAAGVVLWERWITTLSATRNRLLRRLTWSALTLGGLLFGLVMLPVAPINSGLWKLTSSIHDNFVEQIGWPDLVVQIDSIYDSLPTEDQAHTAILTGNYGEAGAVNLYGPALGLPPAISGINSYWLRGYGDPPPETLIVLGYSRERAERHFVQCAVVGQVTNRYNVENEETRNHPTIFLCRTPRQPWPDLWEDLKNFG